MAKDYLVEHLTPFLNKEIIVICNDGTVVQGVMTVVGEDYLAFNEAHVQNFANKTTNSLYSHWHIPYANIQGIGIRDIH